MGTEKSIRVKAIRKADREHYLLRWTDRSGKLRQRTTDILAGRKNKRLADQAARELERELNRPGGELTYAEFCQRYLAEHIPSMKETSASKWRTCSARLERLIGPKMINDVTSEMLSQFAAKLRAEGLSETSITGYMRTLTASFRWAYRLGLMETAPKYHPTRRARGTSKRMRSRPITRDEYRRMLAVVPDVRPDDFRDWQFLLQVLWYSGLRLDEALRLSWSPQASFRVDLKSDPPVYWIRAEAEKGHRDRRLAMSPEMVELLRSTPEAEREGRVVNVSRSTRVVQENIQKIAKRADVVVDDTGKYASAQDFRRAFGTRWAQHLVPAQLQTIMRHQTIQTTMQYYVDLDAQDLARTMWMVSKDAMGDILGDAKARNHVDKSPK